MSSIPGSIRRTESYVALDVYKPAPRWKFDCPVSASGSGMHDDTSSFRDQASQTRQEILDWAAGRGQLMLVALAALVAIAFILAFAGV